MESLLFKELRGMISEIQRCSPVQDIDRLSHSEGVPGVKVKAATRTGLDKTKISKRNKKELKRTNMGLRRKMRWGMRKEDPNGACPSTTR